MSMSTLAHRRRGFTLIELLIVIVVIAILALIVIPRLMGAARKAKESALKSDLQQLRNAIGQFQGDTGYFPLELDDLVDADKDDVAAVQPGTATPLETADLAQAQAAYKGPYLTPSGGLTDAPGIPANPFSNDKATIDGSWTYTPSTGTVVSAVAGTTLDQEDFTKL